MTKEVTIAASPLDAARQAKQKLKAQLGTAKWLRGVGLMPTKHDVNLLVNVSVADESVLAQIPKDVDGIKIVVRAVGEIRALSDGAAEELAQMLSGDAWHDEFGWHTIWEVNGVSDPDTWIKTAGISILAAEKKKIEGRPALLAGCRRRWIVVCRYAGLDVSMAAQLWSDHGALVSSETPGTDPAVTVPARPAMPMSPVVIKELSRGVIRLPIKRFKLDPSLKAEENFAALEKHHIEEGDAYRALIQQLAAELLRAFPT